MIGTDLGYEKPSIQHVPHVQSILRDQLGWRSAAAAAAAAELLNFST